MPSVAPGTQAAGLWEFNADGAMSKHLHPGKAAMNGVLAADLAARGFTAATRILEGERGFFRATSTGADVSRVTVGLGSQWKVSENCYKLHSCCGHTHTAIDTAQDLRTRQGGRMTTRSMPSRASRSRSTGRGTRSSAASFPTRPIRRSSVSRTASPPPSWKAALAWSSSTRRGSAPMASAIQRSRRCSSGRSCVSIQPSRRATRSSGPPA